MAESADRSGTTKLAHKGFDRWWDAMQLQLQMYARIAGLVLLVQGLVISGLCLASTNSTQRSVTAAYYYAKASRYMFSNPTINFVIDDKEFALPAREIRKSSEIRSVAHGQTAKIISIWLLSCALWLVVPVVVKHFKRKAETDMAKEHIRGPQLLTAPQLAAEIKASKKPARVVIGGIPLPIPAETEHIAVFGKTRVGKSVLLYQILQILREFFQKAIVLDVKGDYYAKFFDPAHDVLFNILDSRGAGWNIFNEVFNKATGKYSIVDIEAVGQSMVPDAKGGGNETFFNDAARLVFIAAMSVCVEMGTVTNAALRELIFSSTELMEKALNETKKKHRGHVYVQQPNSNLAGSVHAVLMQYCGWLEFMPDQGDFSLTEWLQDGKPGFLYLSSIKSIAKTLQPVLSLFVDLAARRILSWSEDPDRRLWFMLDEIGSLQRLNAFKEILTVGGGNGAVVIAANQDYSQYVEKYGQHDAESILNSYGTIVALKSKGPATAEILSKMYGKEEFWETKESHVIGTNNNASITQTKDKREEFIINPSEIQYFKKLEYVLQIPDFNPCRGMLEILPVNNSPQKYEKFILRDGFELVAGGETAAPGKIAVPYDPSADYEEPDEDDEVSSSEGGRQVQAGQLTQKAERSTPAREKKEEPAKTAEAKEDPALKDIAAATFDEPSF